MVPAAGSRGRSPVIKTGGHISAAKLKVLYCCSACHSMVPIVGVGWGWQSRGLIPWLEDCFPCGWQGPRTPRLYPLGPEHYLESIVTQSTNLISYTFGLRLLGELNKLQIALGKMWLLFREPRVLYDQRLIKQGLYCIRSSNGLLSLSIYSYHRMCVKNVLSVFVLKKLLPTAWPGAS